MTIARFLTRACTIENPTSNSTDAEGVPTTTITETATVCHAQPYRATPEEVAAGQVYAEGRFRVWLPSGTAVSFSSVFVLDGERFAVLGEPLRWEVGSANDHVEMIVGRFT